MAELAAYLGLERSSVSGLIDRAVRRGLGFDRLWPGQPLIMTRPQQPADDEHGATIIPYENGPLLLRGDFTLRTPDGELIEPGRGTVALCRCGKSAIKPFCDGTHKAVGFRAGPGRETADPRAGDSAPADSPRPADPPRSESFAQ